MIPNGIPCTRFITSFPLLNGPVPDATLPDPVLGERLRSQNPHWLYHLEFLPSTSASFQRFTPAGEDWVRQLRSYLDHSPMGASVSPLELYPDHPDRRALPACAFPIPFSPFTLKGRSWALAVAAGVAASILGQPLPNWVVFSGCLPERLDPWLHLTATSRIEEKIEVCLGRKPEYNCQPVLDRLYHPREAAERCYGPREMRAVPGRIRLLLVPVPIRETHNKTEIVQEGLSPETIHQLGLLPLPQAQLSDFRHADLERRVQELGHGDLLVVQVETLWQALAVLGLEPHGMPAEERLNSERLLVFRAPRERRAGQRTITISFAEQQARQARQHLNDQLAHIPARVARLHHILGACVRQLGCDSGMIACRSARPSWLEVATFWGHDHDRDVFPRFLPVRDGQRGLTWTTARRQIATTRQEFQQLRLHFSGQQLLESRYGPDQCRQYEQFATRIGSCVSFPLQHEEQLLGILCLHRLKEGTFHEDDLFVVQQLVQQVAEEVRQQLLAEQGLRRRMPGRARDLASRVAEMPLATACRQLAQELAELAREHSGAYRTAVRLLNHDRRALTVFGLSNPDRWPPNFRDRIFARTEASACNHALDQQRSYRVFDTRVSDGHYIEVFPPAAAHLAVLISSGWKPIGVLSVDFDAAHREDCTEEMLAELEELAALYAAHLHSFTADRICAELDGCLARLTGTELSAQVLGQFLDIAGHALGTEAGSLFLRDELGCYRALPLPSQLQADGVPGASYQPGEGRTGWVALQKKKLNIPDCDDKRQLTAIRPHITHSHNLPCWDSTRERLAYLGVPVRVDSDLLGNDVLGVLRFVCKTPKNSAVVPEGAKTHFTRQDEDLAGAAASRLGVWLHRREQERRRDALLALVREMHGVAGQRELCALIHRTLEQGVGNCLCVVRAADQREGRDGQIAPVMDRVYLSNEQQHPVWPQFRVPGQGPAGECWRTRSLLRIDDTRNRNTELRRRMRKQFGADEQWWGLVGCAVVAPIMNGTEVIGTLGVGRAVPHTLLDMDVDFIRQVAEVACVAFRQLAEREILRVQEGLLWSVSTFFLDREAGKPQAELVQNLVQEVNQKVRLGLQAEVGYLWVRSTTDPTLWQAPGSGVRLQPLPQELVERELGERPFVVVSDPAEDDRLLPLLEAFAGADDLPPARTWQRAAIRVAQPAQGGFLPELLLLVLVQPPQRLSRNTTERIHRQLTATLVRCTQPLARDRVDGTLELRAVRP